MAVKKVNKTVKIDLKEALKDILPQVFEDNKVNLNKLKSLLNGETIDKEDDRFYFNWAGKSNLFKLIQAPAYGTLKLDKKNSVEFDKTENLMIVGENLETLKLLLKPYFGKIKMIYIDPPYNTGKDFIYKDNFKEPLKDYLEKTGQIDSDGNKLTTNTEASGRYHSDWLNFMYSRLFIARSLLREDGVIFVSIDDNEVHHLRMIMDEIFGEENFIAELPWKGRGGRQDSTYVAVIHEYVILYAKNSNVFSAGEMIKENENFPYYDKLKKRKYKRQLARKWGSNSRRTDRPNLFYSIKSPDGTDVYPRIPNGQDGCWRWSKKTMEEEIANHNIEFVKEGKEWIAYEKIYEAEEGEFNTKKFTTWLDDIGNIANGTDELKELFDDKPPFSFPKPTTLINRLMLVANVQNNDIVLDFFAGSGMTGQAVLDLNKEDNGKRKLKFILAQYEEPIDEKIEAGKNALKLGLKTIADVCVERLRRVSKTYGENKTLFGTQDFGFKVFRLDKSNFNLKDEFEITKEEEAKELKKKYLDWLGMWIKEPLVPGWKPLDVVYEVILKEGFDLNSTIKEIKIKTNEFWHVTDEKQEQEFYISLDDRINKATIEEIRTVKYKNKTFVFLDKALTDNDKLNLKAFVRIKVI